MVAKYTRRPVRHTNSVIPTSPPWKGLNDVQPVAAMEPDYALIFDNLEARPQGPTTRPGSRQYCTGFEVPVKSFIRFHGRVPADNKLFAVSGGGIFDVSTAAEIDADLPISGLGSLSTTNVWWQYTQQTYTTANHNYLIAVNGVDLPLLYNGTWTVASQTVSPSAPGQFKTTDNNGNSVDITKFKDTTLHQQRLWFVLNNSTKGYYCDIAQIGGNLYAFDFGPLFPRGGSLHKLSPWTMDAGGDSGVQTVLIAISTKGDVVIFDGNNPADPDAWRYRGSYQLGAPIGPRCTELFQGELLYLSQDGLYPLSKYLRSAGKDPTQALTYSISNAVARLVSTYSTLPGFELVSYSPRTALLLNVPQPDSKSNFQYSMHTGSGGWGRFTGWPAHCFIEFNGRMYFGTDTAVMEAFVGFTDNADADGANGFPVLGRALGAFTTFPQADLDSIIKTVNGIKPYLSTTNPNISLSIGVNVDFEQRIGQIPGVSVPTVPGYYWDDAEALWDVAMWSGGSTTYNQWFTPLSKPGNNVAVAVVISGNSEITWSKTDWRIVGGFENG